MRNFFIFIFVLLCSNWGSNSLSARSLDISSSDSIVYLFGVSTDLNDSIYYITPIDNTLAKISPKTKFLENRALFSAQLETYLERKYGGVQTAAVFYHTNPKKIHKIFEHLIARYKKKDIAFRLIDNAFHFSINPSTYK